MGPLVVTRSKVHSLIETPWPTAARFGDPKDAEEVVQEALFAAWQAIDQLQSDASLGTWLHRIVVNRALGRMRTAGYQRRAKGIEAGHAMETMPAAWSTTSNLPLEKQVAMRRTIEAALEKIPDDLKVVLLLRDVEELSSKEVSEQLGISDAVVRQRLHRARTAMAEILRPELCDGPELTCGGQVDLRFDYLDESLAEDVKEPVTQHVAGCRFCTDVADVYRSTIRMPGASLPQTETASSGFVARVTQNLLEAR